ncbi:uncharacterized protein LOC107269193 isoform X2 [Cephus cinctus]|uniref:Uncharacterized protein LOC107269193 isoform X2 n=1 Tax=Cephus cinctus TaxID=211228 RepID=A0AAJ7BZH4_CEPCN|nr:uncharacterized protein LOC107269193 isoform X2 [Cephus cinctus]
MALRSLAHDVITLSYSDIIFLIIKNTKLVLPGREYLSETQPTKLCSMSVSTFYLNVPAVRSHLRLAGRKLLRFYQQKCSKPYLEYGTTQKIYFHGQEHCRRYISTNVTMSSAKDSGSAGILSKQGAKELAIRLTTQEREVLILALQECQSQQTKTEYEGHLAAFRWRSKFGRPARVPSLGDVDPTGSYCAVPDDWLLRKYVPQPTRSDLIRVSLANAIPFVGFGFLDNSIMIIAGDQIESSLGAFITLSTMAAAAFGNTISDILGIGSAFYVEMLAQKIGFQPPKLTPIQLDLPKSRRAANLGRVLGVTLGCLLGMTPLLILHQDSKDKDKDSHDSEDKK